VGLCQYSPSLQRKLGGNLTKQRSDDIILRPGTVFADADPEPWQIYKRWVAISFSRGKMLYLTQRLTAWRDSVDPECVSLPFSGGDDE
jgi:hypothetical protein